jgi:hypothetical protein
MHEPKKVPAPAGFGLSSPHPERLGAEVRGAPPQQGQHHEDDADEQDPDPGLVTVQAEMRAEAHQHLNDQRCQDGGRDDASEESAAGVVSPNQAERSVLAFGQVEARSE